MDSQSVSEVDTTTSSEAGDAPDTAQAELAEARATIAALEQRLATMDGPATLMTPLADAAHVADVTVTATTVDDDEDIDAMRADLLLARTDASRLQLENAKLIKTVRELEKQAVRWRGREDGDPAALKTDLAAARSELATNKAALSAAQAKSDAAQMEVGRLTENMAALRREHEAHLVDTGVADLVRAKSALQEANVDLRDELEAAQARMTQLAADLGVASSERKRLQTHVGKLEQALQAKLPKSAKPASVTAQLQQEIGILINENLEMREQVEALERRVRELEAERAQAHPGTPSRPGSQTLLVPPGAGAPGGAGAGVSKGGAVEPHTPMAVKQQPQLLGMIKVWLQSCFPNFSLISLPRKTSS
jgi:hypothetical protein